MRAGGSSGNKLLCFMEPEGLYTVSWALGLRFKEFALKYVWPPCIGTLTTPNS